ncbi:hypothetical protein [uncultured Aquabacterium sp.]|uniref:hypothetical protein n=1 Tax=uncultured Aquabacterium sp. TaxID=158753 RepID=UPI0025EB62D1|nr:hypothetical protein [uncultured Aquabacterium sp.]
MTDRELLELAAKAAGIDYHIDHLDGIPKMVSDGHVWNPLVWDGQALRLAVKLGLCFGPNFDGDKAVCFGGDGRNITEPMGADAFAATRRAITRAAASIGRWEG